MTRVESSVHPSPSSDSDVRPRHHRLDIQGLRGVAVLVVVVFHTGLALPGGFVGVDVFFVISGFVITQLLHTELQATGSIRLGRFYARRARRLLPALAVVSVATLTVASFTASPLGPLQFGAETGRAASVFLANVFLYRKSGGYFVPAGDANPFLHTWTLSVEEQLYLLLPALLVVAWMVGRRLLTRRVPTSVLFSVVLALTAASLVLSVALSGTETALPIDGPQRFSFFNLPTRAWEFGVGVLLALGASRVARAPRRFAVVLGVAGLAAIVAAATIFDDDTVLPGTAALLPVVGAALVLAAGLRSESGASAVLASRPLVVLGDLSYSWYLWHWPAIVVATTVWPASDAAAIAAVVSLAPAALSYRYIEQPIRRNHRIVGWKAVQLAAVCIAVPALAATVVLRIPVTAWPLDPPAQWSIEDASTAAGCTDVGADWSLERCTWSVDGSRGTVLLVGDSEAASVSDGVIAAANDLGYDAVVHSTSGCPFLDRVPVENAECSTLQPRLFELVAALRPDVVVFANRSAGYTRPSVPKGENWRTISTRDGGTPRNQRAALEAWGEGFEGAVRKVAALDAKVLVFAPVPEYPLDFIAQISVVRPHAAVPEIDLDYVDERRGPVLATETEALDALDAGAIFDPVPHLCTSSCRPARDGDWLYYDAFHLSVLGSTSLTRPLADALDALLED